ncbi:MAG: tetratricopeptide repeat protein [Pseudomonadota bacterium]
MVRSQNDRIGGGMTGPKIGLIMTTALASVVLAGSPAAAAPQAEKSFSKAQSALEDGKVDKAVRHAEDAVQAEPRNSSYRALLGAAYLEDGRFEAAATSFDDAIQLGDTDPRSVLSYALAKTALGNTGAALKSLDQWQNDIDPADLGLAYALAGKPERGVHILANALRSGHNSAKVRQNLAYTYALAGNWRGARVMAAEDVPADQLDQRLGQWAATAKPEDVQVRVANLLGVSPSNGAGLPQHLSLDNFPSEAEQRAEAEKLAAAKKLAEAEKPVEAKKAPIKIAAIPAVPSQSEKLAMGVKTDPVKPAPASAPKAKVASKAPVTVPVPAAKPATAPAPVAASTPAPVRTASAPRFVSNPVVQKIPVAAREEVKAPTPTAAPERVARASSQRRMAATSSAASDKKANTHMVQLGSYNSRDEAKRGWVVLQRTFPALKDHDVVITKAEVNGRIFYRVAASGFGVRSARAMCGTVKSAGRGCFAYVKTSPPKGAIESGVRIAARSR